MVLRQPAPYRPEAGAARPSGWSETGVVQAGTEPGRPGCLAKESVQDWWGMQGGPMLEK